MLQCVQAFHSCFVAPANVHSVSPTTFASEFDSHCLQLFLVFEFDAWSASNVPFLPRSPSDSLLESLVKALGEGVYIARFQEPGRAERDFERTGTRESLEKMLHLNFRRIMWAPEGKELLEALPTLEQPS